MANGFVPTKLSMVQGPTVPTGGVGQRRQQEQEQKGMLSTLMGMDVSGMSEQGINMATSTRDYLIDKIINGDDRDFGYEELVPRITFLNDFMARDKKTYTENLAAAKPILDGSVNSMTYELLKDELEKMGKFMSYEEVQKYATDFDLMLENPYGMGNHFSPEDGMVYVQDPRAASRNMQQVGGQHVLGMKLPDQQAFQYNPQDIPTGDVFAYMKSGPESNLLSLLGSVDNSVDAKQKIRNHYETFILGAGPGRKSLQESLSGRLGYDITDLAGRLGPTFANNEEGLQAALVEGNVPYATSFKDNADVVYKEFEEYYMDLFNAEQRKIAAAAAAAREDDVKAPKYNFSKVTLGTMGSAPDVTQISTSLKTTSITSDLTRSIQDPRDRAVAELEVYESINNNGFFEIRNANPIEIQPTPGSGDPVFEANGFSATRTPSGTYIVLNGYQKEPQTYTSLVLPEGGTVLSTKMIEYNGTEVPEYTILQDDETKNRIKPFKMSSPEAESFFASLGNTYLKDVDLSTLNIGLADREEFNQRLGMAIYMKKLMENGAVGHDGELLYNPQDPFLPNSQISNESWALSIINQARLKNL